MPELAPLKSRPEHLVRCHFAEEQGESVVEQVSNLLST
jgi:hypothetical protein